MQFVPRMDFHLAPLPYTKDALEPYLSGLTLEIHYEKHHRGYLEKLKKLLEGKPEADESLEWLVAHVRRARRSRTRRRCGTTTSTGAACGRAAAPVPSDLGTHLELAFGDLAELKSRLADAAIHQFGSGWVWLALDARDRLRVVTTGDAEQSAARGRNAAPRDRRLGARLLPRLPERPRAATCVR